MKVLVTGAKGFVGRNLCEALKNIRDGKDKSHPELTIDDVFEYDISSSKEMLYRFCNECDFVFNLAGVNRSDKESEFKTGNVNFLEQLIQNLKQCENKCPVMLSSSLQASLEGRYNTSYGVSKKEAEKKLFDYSIENGVKVLIYRFPNVFGKWCKPNYNSVIATFCNNIANNRDIIIDNRDTVLNLLYIDDLVNEMLRALVGKETRCNYQKEEILYDSNGKYCVCPIQHHITLGEIADLLYSFKKQKETFVIPNIPKGSIQYKLFSTYISYLPKEDIIIPLKMNCDERGSFTELLKTYDCGQFSVNISRPGIAKGQHWHNSKWEIFVVVSGKALIQERRIGSDDILEFYVDGNNLQAVYMIPGYTHNIINLSDTEDLVTLMWSNEQFNPEKADTFFEKV